MRHAHSADAIRIIGARLAVVATLTLVSGLLFAASAFANLEQVGTFGAATEVPPYGTSVAVNVTGAGGVDAGTVYTVAVGGVGVSVYGLDGAYLTKWGTFGAEAIAIDQSTGYLYVRMQEGTPGAAIRVYKPNGSELVASFGEHGAFKESIAESPEKLHSTEFQGAGGLAVNDAGDLYVSDVFAGATFEPESRIMMFEPQSSGDYEHYVYAGHAKDIAYTTSADRVHYFPQQLALDAAGNLYASSSISEAIYEFAPGEPNTATCTYRVPSGGNTGFAVDSGSGEVYYYTYKHKETIFQLSACNAKKEFEPTGSLVIAPALPPPPSADGMSGLAFDPSASYSPSRAEGILYGFAEDNLGYILAPAEVNPPAVESESIDSVTASDAVLDGVVNPEGWPTHYAFQYISDAAYQANEPADRFAGAREAPLGGGMLGGGKTGVAVSASLLGLAADTEYHFRLVATSHCNSADEAEVCEAVGAAQSFRTYPVEAAGLPDGRAYELVSPALKYGGEVLPLSPGGSNCAFNCNPGIATTAFPRLSAPDGEAIVYEGQPFSPEAGALGENEYISSRTGTGWQTTTLSPALQSYRHGYVGFDASLSKGVLLQGADATLAGEAPAGYPDLYSQPTSEPFTFSPLVTTVAPNRGGGSFNPRFAGGSSDFSHLFFSANDTLTEETPFAPAASDGGALEDNLYESFGGKLKLVNVLPGNTATAPGAVFGSGKQLKSQAGRFEGDFSHAISDDGSRVFWSDEAGQAYVRENGEATLAIPDSGGFLTASADGSKVLLSDGHIYDLQDETVTDLTAGHGGFEGIAGQSEDLSHLYFVDTAVLTGAQASERGEIAQAGDDNLYSWDEGKTTFVAALDPNDEPDLTPGGYPYGDWDPDPQVRSAEASPDGRWLTFMSVARLTGYDNTGLCIGGIEGGEAKSGLCSEVFVYDSATGRLTCASCDPSGVSPIGKTRLPSVEEGGAPAAFGQVRYLTDDGRVFFDTSDSLSPFDTNGIEDVYEYEPGGVGSCLREAGCTRLISGGRGTKDSSFVATDATGKNVFFTTSDRLVAVDHDELVDLYDAREGGGLASQGEVAGRGECHGDACQPPVAVAGDPAISSLSFEGAGDMVEPPRGALTKKRLTRAQKLARALRACAHKRKRAICRREARKRFHRKARRARRAHRAGASLGNGKKRGR